jgi:hypothetical protein
MPPVRDKMAQRSTRCWLLVANVLVPDDCAEEDATMSMRRPDKSEKVEAHGRLDKTEIR